MYGKIMSISDEMMWRYYELLTDVQVADIERMKRETHPMQAKKDLARRIVADFHSAEAATKAAEDWAKQFQKDAVPDDVETVQILLENVRAVEQGNGGSTPLEDSVPVRIDKLLRYAGLATSNTEASGKVKEGAVAIDGQEIDRRVVWVRVRIGDVFVIRVGRRMKKVRILDPAGGRSR
jgi:tyrosyl-tRNA synthetase